MNIKRYWQSILIIIVILVTISTYYLQSSFASDYLPQFTFTKISGDESHIDGITITADYTEQSLAGMYDRIVIEKDHASFTSDLSFIERLDHYDDRIKNYRKEYRSFMRGKLGIYSFYEDEKSLAYADVKWVYGDYVQPDNGSFVIDVLDKETEQVITSFQYDVPNVEDFHWVSVEDVQLVDRKLNITTRNHPKNYEEEMEIHVYTFDLDNQELISDQELLSIPSTNEGQGWTDVVNLNETDNVEPNNYLVLKKMVMEEVRVPEEEYGEYNERSFYEADEVPYGMEVKENQLFAYNYETNEIEEISLPEELQVLMDAATIRPYNDEIYFITSSEDGLEVTSYHIGSQEIGTKQTFDLAITPELNPFIKINNGKMYVVATNQGDNLQQKETNILVTDIHSGETLYEGKLEIKDPNSNQSDYELYIYEINMKD
ncbi:hypothetical protein GMD78_13930 [Ornithinibacillus sp. L9]|uniref:Uncharacterized protein n=1 Tax=Ornithinibacillus caprae TaxID=2678566 RepID=A0A6N8FIH3_9BACI|nr:hypothetical protein [Ornithinibacillus caprae]MUK89462.1 hypothetical protein [Ornithinibacillus caprae]